ncbi:MAG: hypothetical protein GXO79_02210, partial [Chlorobi bacterium]|nr:hypothetical protein [Chlorobiota bacterium]
MLNKKNIIKPFLVIIITILFFFSHGLTYSQNNIFYNVIDTLSLQKGDKLVLPDTSIVIHSDTTIYIPSQIKYHIKKNPETVSENFYKKIEEKYSGKKWSKKMYNLFFRPPAKSYNRYNAVNRQSEIPFSKYKGYPIKTISIKKLQVFGPSVYDTNITIQKWYIKKANQLHINTRTIILKKSLLFKEGQQLNPIDISESERIIRSLPYIRDVKIYVKPDETGNYVDIIVITQDLWTLGVEVEMTNINSAVIDVFNKNIAGLGHQQTNTIYYNYKDNNYNGYNGYYKIKNQFGAFINTELNYYNRYQNEKIRLNISRGFYTPQIKYAGGFTIMQNGLPPVETVTKEKSIIKSPIKYNY